MDALFPTNQPPNFSYWEIETYLTNIDLLVVGSGIVGLTTAIYCKQASPKLRILVLERGALPSGASTKNAGFACFGSASELLADLRTQPQEVVMERVKRRITGLAMLRQLLGNKTIGYESCGGYELFNEGDSALWTASVEFAQWANVELKSLTKLPTTYSVADRKIGQFGFQGVSHMLFNRAEGAIHTGKMMEALVRKARGMGIRILTGMGVRSMEERTDGVSVILDNGHELSAAHAHVATNGFAQELMSELEVRPARAQVLITSPVSGLKVKGTFHLDEGYYYFRNVGDRLLLGGGRNLDIEGETTSQVGITVQIQDKLEELLKTVILPNAQYSIAHRWSGVMGLGSTKDTLVTSVSGHVTCAVRMGGMGVALGTSIGKDSAEMILGKP